MPWKATDGTLWVYSPELSVWNGWLPGEDGLWELSPDEMDKAYPEHPRSVNDAMVERLCEVMHDAYEAAAADQGWETQERSRKPWADVPEANKATMRAAVRAMLEYQAAADA